MTSFPSLACTLWLSQGSDKWHKERAPLCYLDSLIKPNIIYGPMAQKYKAQIYSTWPKYKAQIILNYSKQFIQIRGLLLNILFSPKGFLNLCIWARATD